MRVVKSERAENNRREQDFEHEQRLLPLCSLRVLCSPTCDAGKMDTERNQGRDALIGQKLSRNSIRPNLARTEAGAFYQNRYSNGGFHSVIAD